MFCSRQSNNLINKIHERSLRISYKDQKTRYHNLLETHNGLMIHQRNLQVLMTEIYKIVDGVAPPIMNYALKCSGYCKECQLDMQALKKCECEKTALYELLRTGMLGGSGQVFTSYHTHKTSCIWRKRRFDKGCHRL